MRDWNQKQIGLIVYSRVHVDIMTGLTLQLTFSCPPYQTHTGFHSGLCGAASADRGGLHRTHEWLNGCSDKREAHHWPACRSANHGLSTSPLLETSTLRSLIAAACFLLSTPEVAKLCSQLVSVSGVRTRSIIHLNYYNTFYYIN